MIRRRTWRLMIIASVLVGGGLAAFWLMRDDQLAVLTEGPRAGPRPIGPVVGPMLEPDLAPTASPIVVYPRDEPRVSSKAPVAAGFQGYTAPQLMSGQTMAVKNGLSVPLTLWIGQMGSLQPYRLAPLKTVHITPPPNGMVLARLDATGAWLQLEIGVDQEIVEATGPTDTAPAP